MIKLRTFRHRQHQAGASAVEEAHLGNRKQMLEVERLFVKSHRSFQVMHGNGDLPDSGLSEVNRTWHKRSLLLLIREEPRAAHEKELPLRPSQGLIVGRRCF